MTPNSTGGQDDGLPRLAGAFAPLRALEGMDVAARRRLFDMTASCGVTYVLTEGVSLPAWLPDELGEAGLALGSGIACFSDHATAVAAMTDRLRPVTATGEIRPQMEWYRGIIPTDRGYEEGLIDACVRAATQHPLRLFVLDFIRWPLHWELELRAGAQVIDASFDRVTLGRFRDEMGFDIPVDDPAASAKRLHGDLRDAWTTFKCRVITDIVERITRRIRDARPGLPLGAFIVPGDEAQRRSYAGQDVRALSRHLDVLLPMTYHAILRRPSSWIGETVSEMRQRSTAPIVPVIQVTADPSISGGNDWGVPFTPAALGAAIDAGLDAGGWGFVLFPAHGLGSALGAEVRPRALRLSVHARQGR